MITAFWEALGNMSAMRLTTTIPQNPLHAFHSFHCLTFTPLLIVSSSWFFIIYLFIYYYQKIPHVQPSLYLTSQLSESWSI